MPTKHEWLIWRKVLRIALCTGGNGRLEFPVGEWLEQHVSICVTDWRWYVSLDCKFLYETYNNQWKRYTKQFQSYITRTCSSLYTSGSRCRPPNKKSLLRTVVHAEGEGWRATGTHTNPLCIDSVTKGAPTSYYHMLSLIHI